MEEKATSKLGHSSRSDRVGVNDVCICYVSYPVLVIDDLDDAAVFVLHRGRRHWLFRLHRLCRFLLQLLLKVDAKHFSQLIHWGSLHKYIPSLLCESAPSMTFLINFQPFLALKATRKLWLFKVDQDGRKRCHGQDETGDVFGYLTPFASRICLIYPDVLLLVWVPITCRPLPTAEDEPTWTALGYMRLLSRIPHSNQEDGYNLRFPHTVLHRILPYSAQIILFLIKKTHHTELHSWRYEVSSDSEFCLAATAYGLPIRMCSLYPECRYFYKSCFVSMFIVKTNKTQLNE